MHAHHSRISASLHRTLGCSLGSPALKRERTLEFASRSLYEDLAMRFRPQAKARANKAKMEEEMRLHEETKAAKASTEALSLIHI